MFNVTRRKSDSAVQQQHHNQHQNQNHHQQSQQPQLQQQPQQQPLQQQQQQSLNYNLIKEKPKFKRCVSIARLFGNAYSTSPHMSRQKNIDAGVSTVKARILFKNRYQNTTGSNSTTTAAANVANKSKIERFKNRSESQIDRMASSDCTDSSCKPAHLPIEDFCDEKDLSARAIRTISKGLSLIWRRSYSVEISTPDPEYKVFYLGNVLTGWAKGDNCIEKPLATLWRNYTQINKPDVTMRILVCSSGLKATTRQHGLTEYWANRITYCCSPKNYPRVFCWIYRHEGRKLKHELRCHAVLCPKESIAEEICKTLKENLSQALKEFKRDKINRQNARLSLVNSLYENPSMPRRKILLSVGANNYRPPMERSKSAPKLMAIEEAVGEEDEIYEISSKPSFKKSQSHLPYYNSALYSAASIDRKCRRNRYNGSGGGGGGGRVQPLKRVNFQTENSKSNFTELETIKPIDANCNDNAINDDDDDNNSQHPSIQMDHENSSLTGPLYDEDDELNSLLLTNDSSLSGEILSYLDNRLSRSSSVLDDHTETETGEIDLHPNGMGHSIENISINDHQLQHHFKHTHSQSMDNALDSSQFEFESYNSAMDDYCSLDTINNTITTTATTNLVCNQNGHFNDVPATPPPTITTTMTSRTTDATSGRTSVDDCTPSSRCIQNESMNFLHSNGCNNTIIPFLMDSDEGSITSGCETSSIITTAHMDELMKSEREIDAITLSLSRLPKHSVPCNLERVSENDNSNQHKSGNDADDDDDGDDDDDVDVDDDDEVDIRNNSKRIIINNNNICNGNDSNNNNNSRNSNEEDSEFSDESGFDENNIGKSNNFRIHNDTKNLNCEKSIDTTMASNNTAIADADANNNVKLTFSPSATKNMGRLRINIPKNAKSIDI